MDKVKCFSPEVCNEIGYYVYRLIDPRDGSTFYVGKGVNNRVFAHAHDAIDNFNGTSYLEKNEDRSELKCEQIREIINEGLEVIYIIQKYGMDENTAFIVESVLIDAFNSQRQLTNKIRGFDSSKGPINAVTLQENISLKEYEETDDMPPYIIIKINNYWRKERKSTYETVRKSWKLNLNHANKYKYVIAAETGTGKVLDVYEVLRWYKSPESPDRIMFDGKVAKPEIRNMFIKHKIPAKYRVKGISSPTLYSKNK